MPVYLIYDAAVLAILLFFLIRGWRKGFILTLCSLLAVFMALIGARLLTDALAPTVSGALQPRFSAVIEEQFSQSISREVDDGMAQHEDSAIVAILKSLGFYDRVSRAISDTVKDKTARTVSEVSASLSAAVADTVARVLVFVVAFLAILVLWFLFSRLLDLTARLPVLHTLNGVLGGVAGLAKGALVLFLAAWAMRLMGGLIPQETVDRTVLLRFFCQTNPMDLLIHQA